MQCQHKGRKKPSDNTTKHDQVYKRHKLIKNKMN